MHNQQRDVYRTFVEYPDAIQRWDRAYQAVLHLLHDRTLTQHQDACGAPPDADQEVKHETCTLCPGVHRTPGPDPHD